MSVKLFTLQLFGKLKSAEQIEARRYSLLSDYHEFLAVDQSDELKEFYNLEKFVNSGEFKDRMKAVK